MAIGIIVCGLNGAGKSTLGRALASALHLHFIDKEDLVFPDGYASGYYAAPRSRAEAEAVLAQEIAAYPNFVFASVRGNCRPDIAAAFTHAVWVQAPKALRMQRVRMRSFEKFGDRMLPGGDLYAQEEAFFRLAESRTDADMAAWVQSLSCPVIRVDGEKPLPDKVAEVVAALGIEPDRQD